MYKDLRDLVKSYLPPTISEVIHTTLDLLKRDVIYSVTGYVIVVFYKGKYNENLADYEHILDFKRICENVLIAINIFIKWRYDYILNNFLTLDVVDPRNWLISIIERAKVKNNRSQCRLIRTITENFLDDK